MAPACQSFYQKYCEYFPNGDQPSPTPMTRFPAVCTPDRTPEEEPVETEPIQNGVPDDCKYQPTTASLQLALTEYRVGNKWHFVTKGRFVPGLPTKIMLT